MLMAVLFIHPVTMILGFALIGLGFSSIAPIIYSWAGKSNKVAPNLAITSIATIAFIGLFIGPTLIGFLSEILTLRYALLIVPVMCAIGIILSIPLLKTGRVQ